jgi:hypothetical protein
MPPAVSRRLNPFDMHLWTPPLKNPLKAYT